PIADLPGIGEMILTSADFTAYEMFFDSAVTRSTLTAGPSSISYLVTVGPRVNPVTCASTWNCSSTSVSAATTMSLARVRCFGAEPGRSSAVGGSVYATASPALSVSCSGFRSGADGGGTVNAGAAGEGAGGSGRTGDA